MECGGHDKGYVIAFSFTRNAREEVMRVRRRLDIQLVTVADLLRPQSEVRAPLMAQPASATELPLPSARNRVARTYRGRTNGRDRAVG